MNKRQYLVGGFLVFLLLCIASYVGLHLQAFRSAYPYPTPTPTTQTIHANVTYSGKTGKTAQAILSSQYTVTFDHSGMVSGINNRLADRSKHEYWAFYVNGKMSPVGASSYVTKDTDKIEWKIDKY